MGETLLTVDVGNSLVKLSVFEGERVVYAAHGKGLGSEAVEAVLDFHTLDGAAYCAVGEDSGNIRDFLEELEIPTLILDSRTPLPIEVRYESRDSLGADRLCAAIGAVAPGESALVVDAGTAVTADVVADGVFLGGNISPGLALRFMSLNRYTSKLPAVEAHGDIPPFGYNTETAIRAGVVRGLAAEIAADFAEALKINENMKIILTGGDAGVLYPFLQAAGLEADLAENAVGVGLVRIFNHNNCL